MKMLFEIGGGRRPRAAGRLPGREKLSSGELAECRQRLAAFVDQPRPVQLRQLRMRLEKQLPPAMRSDGMKYLGQLALAEFFKK